MFTYVLPQGHGSCKPQSRYLPGEIHTWYCGGTGGRACWGAAERAAPEDWAGGRGTGCLGWRGPAAEPPLTAVRPGEMTKAQEKVGGGEREGKYKSQDRSRGNTRPPPHPYPTPLRPRPYQAAQAPAPAPCALGPGSRLLAAVAAPARWGELPSQKEGEGQAASVETQWRSGSPAAGQGTEVRMGPLHRVSGAQPPTPPPG